MPYNYEYKNEGKDNNEEDEIVVAIDLANYFSSIKIQNE